ncbi:unnamed protein product [Absidia cylindrospora]
MNQDFEADMEKAIQLSLETARLEAPAFRDADIEKAIQLSLVTSRLEASLPRDADLEKSLPLSLETARLKGSSSGDCNSQVPSVDHTKNATITLDDVDIDSEPATPTLSRVASNLKSLEIEGSSCEAETTVSPAGQFLPVPSSSTVEDVVFEPLVHWKLNGHHHAIKINRQGDIRGRKTTLKHFGEEGRKYVKTSIPIEHGKYKTVQIYVTDALQCTFYPVKDDKRTVPLLGLTYCSLFSGTCLFRQQMHRKHATTTNTSTDEEYDMHEEYETNDEDGHGKLERYTL